MDELEAKVRFLSSPAAHGPDEDGVEARETHMSWVFLTRRRVLKLKKPIRRPHIDFSTIDRRRHFCAEEVRLNRRLAARTYRGILPLCRRDDGFSIGGGGPVADWLVEMERLPEAEMLDSRIRAGRLAEGEIARLADILASFYEGARVGPEAGAVYIARLDRELDIDAVLLLRPSFALGPEAERLVAAVRERLRSIAPEIGERARRGLIVEGHGDLRPEHVWLGDPIQIIDCLEFDRSFRLLDPHDEIRFLGLECAILGADWIGPLMLARLEERLGAPPGPQVVATYAALQALTRARLALAHLLDTPVRKPEKWRPLALRYLAEAERALTQSG
jgi:aminoglycoside phosphotransferase family enzyme